MDSQLKNSVIEGLDNVDIRIAVFREHPETLKVSCEKALAENNLRNRIR